MFEVSIVIDRLTEGAMECIKILLEKGLKNIVVFITLLICIIISISPTFLFVFIFNDELFSNISTTMIIVFIITISCILLYLIYMVTAIGNIDKQDCQKNYLDIISNLSYSLLKLSILSFVIITSYCVMYLNKSINYNNMILIVGIYLLIIFLISLIKFTLEKIRRNSELKENSKKYKKLLEDFKLLKEKLDEITKENQYLKRELKKYHNT